MRIVSTVLLCLTLLAFGWGQNQPTLVSFSGTVEDPSGARTAKADVILDAGTPHQRIAKTDATGTFQFDAVTVGQHTLQVQAEGFALFSASVEVRARSTAAFRTVLAISDSREITVNEAVQQVTTEGSANQDANSIDSQQLADVPVFDQDYISTMSMFLDDGSTGTNGTTLVVDGMEANKVGVSASAVKEVKINNDPYSAEFSRPGRGRIEVVTKPPEPQYHGTLNFIFRDSALNSRDYFENAKPAEQRRIYEGYLGGPIANSKSTSFLVSVDRREEDVQSTVYAYGINGLIQQNVPSPARNLEISGRIDHYFSEDNNLSIRYSYEGRSKNNQGVGGFTLPEAGSNNAFREDEFVINSRAVITPKLLNQFRLLFGAYNDRTSSITNAPSIVVMGAFTTGGAQADFLRAEHHVSGYDNVSYSSGRHMIKAGISVPDFSRRGFDDYTNTRGTFTFSGFTDANGNVIMSAIDAYRAGLPSQYSQQAGNGKLHFNEKVISGFVQDEFKLRPNLTITPGLRYDWQNYFGDNNNFAPRMSVAYSPGSAGTTVLRGGVGLFYDRTGPRPIADLLHYNGTNLMRYVLTGSGVAQIGYPDPFSDGLTMPPPSIVRLAPNIRIPYTIQYSFGAERQVSKATTLSATYIHSRGIDLFRSINTNAPLDPADPTVLSDPRYGIIREIQSEGRQNYNALEVQVRGKITRFFNGQAQYRLSRSMNNTQGIGYQPANPFDPNADWALADWDARHRFNMLGSIDPGRYLKFGVGLRAGSGHPYTETLGDDLNKDGVFNDRPAGVGRNTLQGTGFVSLDLRTSRDFYLSARKEQGPVATVALDAFNVLNHTNFASFVGDVNSEFFGKPVSSRSARRLQLGARLTF